MSRKQAELLLAAVILTRSSAYLFSKTGLETLGTFNLLAARFLLGVVVLGIIFFRRLKYASRRDIIGGAIIGVGARRRVPQRAGHRSGRVRRAAHPRKSVYSASARAFRRAQEKDRINRIIKSTAPHVFREVLCFCILISRARGWGDRCRFREAR